MTRSEEKSRDGPQSPADYVKLHQGAFRCAFDFLTSHFPPGSDPEWWDQTATEASAASESQLDNPLVMKLLNAVMDYLEIEYKERREDHE